MKKLFVRFRAAFVAIAFLPSLASASEPLWKLDLAGRELGEAVDLAPGLEIVEEDGQRFVRKSSRVTQFFPMSIPMGREVADWGNIEFAVRFRLTESRGVTLVFKRSGGREEVEYMNYYLWIGLNEVKLTCHGLKENSDIEAGDPRLSAVVKYADLGAPDIGTWEWITATLTVTETEVKAVITTEDGGVREAEFKTFAGGGGAIILASEPVDVAEISLKTAAE